MSDTPEPNGFLPISEHGLIGDLRTAALVGSDGTLNWLCAPRFDSPSVFGALLDQQGGSWVLAPVREEDATARQFYLPDTNVLVTRFSGNSGVVEVRDFMPVLKPHDPYHRQRVVRQAVAVRGSMRLTTVAAPRFDYARAEHRTSSVDGGVRFETEDLTLVLRSTIPLEVQDGRATGSVTLQVGQTAAFVLALAPDDDASPLDVTALLDGTVRFWRSWIGHSRYRGRWREWVERAALTLKLLTHEPSGAIIAAPTTSLPEDVGGSRNWDYRHVWVRDAAFTLYALLRLGFLDEASAFMGWLVKRVDPSWADPNGPLKSMYDLDGRSTTGEYTLDHWSGYRDSSPVRIRNDAADQLQIDIYGEMIDSVYLWDKYGDGIPWDGWQMMIRMADWIQDNWDRPDESIWETRGGRRSHTFSRVMSWVALERMMRMSRRRGLPGDLASWQRTRDAIATAVFTESWSEDLSAFTQYPGSEVLDASLLLMPSVKFVAASDPRFTSTLAAIEEALVTDTLVFRYDASTGADGLHSSEGTFSMCSFWYVEALTRVGRLEDARLALEKMFTYASPLGLFAEEISVKGEQMGNFPQAFTHLSLISAAINLDRALP